jgi:hypothetical protein
VVAGNRWQLHSCRACDSLPLTAEIAATVLWLPQLVAWQHTCTGLRHVIDITLVALLPRLMLRQCAVTFKHACVLAK